MKTRIRHVAQDVAVKFESELNRVTDKMREQNYVLCEVRHSVGRGSGSYCIFSAVLVFNADVD